MQEQLIDNNKIIMLAYLYCATYTRMTMTTSHHHLVNRGASYLTMMDRVIMCIVENNNFIKMPGIKVI